MFKTKGLYIIFELAKNATTSVFVVHVVKHETKNILVIFLYCSTRYRCSQSHKGNSIDRIFQVNEATQMSCNVTNHRGTNSDHSDRHGEAGVTIGQA